MKDQGWGNRKAKVVLLLCSHKLTRSTIKVNEYSKFIQDNMIAQWESPIAEHEWTTGDIDLSDHPVMLNQRPGMFQEIWTVAGGGGGHHIYINEF